MRFPLHIAVDNLRHQIKHAIKGDKRFPMVLMLEPLYSCNLACLGCALERHSGKIEERLPVEKCFQAAQESGAPVVSICGGEPTTYPELKVLIDGLIARKRHIYLCTNALLLEKKVFGIIPPHKRLSLNIHLDGTRETHDHICARKGVFDQAIAMIKEGKRLGFHVTTNTTVFKETNIQEIEELCRLLADLGIDGMQIAPGYHYESIERDIFPVRQEIHEKFRRVLELSKRYRLQSTPMYLEFAAGLREYKCSPWSTVTFTPKGWKAPCHLIGKRFYETWREFWEGVDWNYWESRQDRLCQNCLMHSGFETSAVMELRSSPRDLARLAYWNFSG
jgi:hopanoid biosynthesis associated radical SAM protein HpnH